MAKEYLLAIDQGTTSTRAVLFTAAGEPVRIAQEELPQIIPRDGWVEHDAEAIWRATVGVVQSALEDIAAGSVAGVGITNQRETTVLWDRRTGVPVHNAIVWQDRRGADHCRRIVGDGHAGLIRERTGLVVDSYFSATKIAWLLDNVDGLREKAETGHIAFGTIDSFLLWRLTGGRVHASDATNADRTMLFDIHRQCWDDELLDLFGVPRQILPEVRDCAADFGVTDAGLFGTPLAIGGSAGDQHAALIGQACLAPGMAKATYGTGCFVLLNTGPAPVEPGANLLTTMAYRIAGIPTYAVEGSVFDAGTAIKWLSDNLGVIDSAGRSEDLARSVADTGGVMFVPSFSGLGAPHWDASARGAILGLTRDTGIAEIVRAALEAAAYQSADLLAAMVGGGNTAPTALRVDGGMAVNDWFLQFLADVLDVAVERPTVTESTALGAALLAGLQAGVYGSLEDAAATWRLDRRFEPAMEAGERAGRLAAWARAVDRVRG